MTDSIQLKSHCSDVAKQMQLDVSEHQLDLLMKYIEQLQRWNKVYNLTAIRDTKEMLVKHIFDSFSIAPFIQQHSNKHSTIIDVGTGPGIPGMILSIILPDYKFTLLDSNGKKTRFLVNTQRALNLNNVNIVNERVENYHPQHKFAIILARAFAAVDEVMKLCHHLCDEDGQYLLMKGQFPTNEIKNMPPGFKLVQHQLHVPELNAERHLLQITRG